MEGTQKKDNHAKKMNESCDENIGYRMEAELKNLLLKMEEDDNI
jgi:hypothetical protein